MCFVTGNKASYKSDLKVSKSKQNHHANSSQYEVPHVIGKQAQ